MRVPLTVLDFIERAELVYGDRIGVVDEPEQPAPTRETTVERPNGRGAPIRPIGSSLGEMTWKDVARLARAQAAGLDALGVEQGERVAIVSHNSARLLTSFFGVSAYGRVLVPINFRLNAEEVAYIVEHSGASVVLIDPELDDAMSAVGAKHRFVIGAEADEALLRYDTEPEPWIADEEATGTINYTSGTTARPKGVQLTHRSLWVNATTFGWQTGVSDRDSYLWTLPMFHCNGWGMSYAITGMGGTHIVLRKVDGPEILRRVERHGVTLLCGAPAVVAAILDAAATWDGPIPGRDRVRMVVAGAPPPTKTIERMETELGWEFIQIYGLTETAPLLTMNRRTRRGRRALAVGARGAARSRGCARARCAASHLRPRRGAGPLERRARGLLGESDRVGRRARRRLVPHRRRRHARRRALPDDQRPQEGRDHLRRRERQLDRSRGLPVSASRRSRRRA